MNPLCRAIVTSTLLLLGACSSAAFSPGDSGNHEPSGDTLTDLPARSTKSADVVDLFVQCREAERRRDPRLAQQTLHFRSTQERELYFRELYYLAGRPAGPIIAPQEVHLVARPPGGGAGEYLLLEPSTAGHVPTSVTIVTTQAGPRILYRPPDLTEKEKARLPAQSAARMAAERRAIWWTQLPDAELTTEVARLRTTLKQQIAAQQYAAARKIQMVPLAVDPAVVLAHVEGQPPERVRDLVVSWLHEAAVPPPTPRRG